MFHYFSKAIVLPFETKMLQKDDINTSLFFQYYSLGILCKILEKEDINISLFVQDYSFAILCKNP